MTNFRSKLALFGLLFSLSAAITFAQTITGSISGTVKDSSGAVLPNAQIQVLNQDTGVSRTLQSDSAGHYSALLLPLGNYQVTATAQGFQKEVRSGILLTVGREAVVDLSMAVGAMTQTVEVAGEAAQINTTSAAIQGLVSGEQIRELPLNGRSYTDLALLNPGVIYDRMTGSSASDGFGVRMSLNGARFNYVLYLVDGTITNDTSGTAGTVNADNIGVEGIREFSILSHNYSAEFGHSAGGVVNAVTRSGTNQFHGSLYEFLRNNAIDARNFYQQGPEPEFRRNQFGGAVGGPIKKDKLFFFSNYEGFRQVLGTPANVVAPDANMFAGIIPIGGVLTHVGVSPVIAPYLALFQPLVTGHQTIVNQGDGTQLVAGTFIQPINENYFMNRVDYHVSDKDSLYARDIYDTSNRTRPNSDYQFSVLDNANNYFAQIGETHIFTADAFNDFRIAFNRTARYTDLGPQPANVPPSFVAGQPLGRMIFTGGSNAANATGGGLSGLGNLNAEPLYWDQNVWEEGDTFALIRGKHSFKFGVDLQRYQTNRVTGGGIRTSWTFGGPLSFLQAQPTQQDTGQILGQVTPAECGCPNGETSVIEFGYRQWLPSWFIVDDWRVSSRLTLNLGLRQEWYTDPTEVNGLAATLPTITSATSVIGPPYQSAKLNFAPRIGLAWDPTGSGKTSIRFGAGTYFNQVNIKEAGPSDYQFTAAYSEVCNWTAGAKNPCAGFPLSPLNPVLNGSKSEGFVQSPLPTPTVIQYGLDVQHQLTSTLSVRLGYVGWYGYHMTRSFAANTNNPVPGTNGLVFPSPAGSLGKVNPAFGTITELADDAMGNYNGLQAELKKSLGRGLTFQFAYTFSKTLSDADSTANRLTDNTGVGYVTMNPANLGADYGLSATDQRHLIAINSQYQLPFASHSSGLAKEILGGWQLGGIFQWGSGLPLDVTNGFNNSLDGDPVFAERPNLNPGFSNSPTSGTTGAGCGAIPANQPVGTPNRWFNPCAFSLPPAGTFGNLGRDTVEGPGFTNLDFTLTKNFRITETMRLEFKAEGFDIFNHTNFGAPSLALFTSNRQYSGGDGSILITAPAAPGSSRQFQFGLKLVF